MTTPRPHAELMKRWIDDDKLECWGWSTSWKEWELSAYGPTNPLTIYFLGPKPTSPPRKMCTLGGLQFPAPETVAPPNGTACWSASSKEDINWNWRSCASQIEILKDGQMHLNGESAKAHRAAQQAANAQAIAEAV